MRKSSTLSQLIGALFVSAALSTAAFAADKAFVTVNGVAVSQNLANFFIAEQKSRGAPDSPELKEAVREELIRRELIMQAVKKSGLDKKPEVIAQAEAERQGQLIRIYIQDYAAKNPIPEAKLRADYEKIKEQLGETEYKSRHILVATEEEAKALIEKLAKGEKFETLATQSTDPGSKENGGDLGWSSPASFVKPFGDALASLEKGKYTEVPVKSDFGYHVILLEDTRPLAAPSFEELQPRLMQQAQSEQISKMMDDLRSKAKIN